MENWRSCTQEISHASRLNEVREQDIDCWHNEVREPRRMDLLKCFQPDQKSGLVYATPVAATIVTLLVMMFLKFTNASKPNKRVQLEKKQVMRPKVMTAGYCLIFLSSKVGLASLTMAATTGAQYLLLTNEFASRRTWSSLRRNFSSPLLLLGGKFGSESHKLLLLMSNYFSVCVLHIHNFAVLHAASVCMLLLSLASGHISFLQTFHGKAFG